MLPKAVLHVTRTLCSSLQPPSPSCLHGELAGYFIDNGANENVSASADSFSLKVHVADITQQRKVALFVKSRDEVDDKVYVSPGTALDVSSLHAGK